MGTLTTAGKNTALDAVGGAITHVALHSGAPGATGASNEISGGSPAYARRAIDWNAAASGNLDSSTSPEFDVPAGTTVSHWSGWTASTGGTCLVTGALSASEAFTAQGKYTLADADIAASDPA